jgi:hypothetical protein
MDQSGSIEVLFYHAVACHTVLMQCGACLNEKQRFANQDNFCSFFRARKRKSVEWEWVKDIKENYCEIILVA